MKRLKTFLTKAKTNNYVIRLVTNETKIYVMQYRKNSFRLVDCLVKDKTDERIDLVNTFCKDNKMPLVLE